MVRSLALAIVSAFSPLALAAGRGAPLVEVPAAASLRPVPAPAVVPVPAALPVLPAFVAAADAPAPTVPVARLTPDGAQQQAGAPDGARQDGAPDSAQQDGVPDSAQQAGALFDGGPLPPSGGDDDPYPSFTLRQRALQVSARVALLAQRTALLPVHAWPLSAIAKKIAHGEAFAGLRPASATQAAKQIQATHAVGAVVGRLSWELHDVWSVRGAVSSYSRLIDEIIRAKAQDPKLDIALSLDVESLGGQLDGLSAESKREIAKKNIERLARKARDAGIPVELDIGASAVMPILLDVAHALVRDLRMPVRLALSARYEASQTALREWADLAREMGFKLGVRLIKGSFIEGDRPGTINLRQQLLEQYKRLITAALERSEWIDTTVATHNEDIWGHAKAESERLKASFTLNAIRGINPEAQQRMRAAGDLSREYLSFGVDTPVMALMETWTNWLQKRAMRKAGARGEID